MSFLIVEESEPQSRFGIRTFHSAKLGIEGSIRAGYFFKNLFHWKLPHEIEPGKTVHFVSAFELSAALNGTDLGSTRTREIQRFYGESVGAFTFSRVGFNFKRTRAVVYVQNLCGLCGEGFYALLEKYNGKWAVISKAGTWIS
jgi:hypothetical protein